MSLAAFRTLTFVPSSPTIRLHRPSHPISHHIAAFLSRLPHLCHICLLAPRASIKPAYTSPASPPHDLLLQSRIVSFHSCIHLSFARSRPDVCCYYTDGLELSSLMSSAASVVAYIYRRPDPWFGGVVSTFAFFLLFSHICTPVSYFPNSVRLSPTPSHVELS